MGLRVEADLAVVADGVPARVRDDGEVVVIEAEDPLALGRALVRSGAGASRLAWLGERLAAQGVTVRVDGPAGTVLTLGAEARPTLPRRGRLAGVALGSPRGVLGALPAPARWAALVAAAVLVWRLARRG
ncbi:MAG: hypothetical protein R6T85_00770 [Egibacteraceae bacterium]